MDNQTIHVISTPHTISTEKYLSCAFTQKTIDFIKMMNLFDYNIVHYGIETSNVDCESVDVISYNTFKEYYPNLNLNDDNILGNLGNPYRVLNQEYYSLWANNTIEHLLKTIRYGDIICYFSPYGSRLVCEGMKHYIGSDCAHVEAGIGYPSKSFSDFRCFTTYTHMSWMLSKEQTHPKFSDWVIPYWVDESDFDYSSNDKEDYFVFFGRMLEIKGINIAMQVSEKCNKEILMYGLIPENFSFKNTKNLKYMGVVSNLGERKNILSKAKAMFMPTMYLEPFGLSGVESLLSGTPVISTDWASFSEWNLHGYTGYRCRTFSEFCWAANNIDSIDNEFCYNWAKGRYTLPVVGKKFDRLFKYIQNIYNGDGFYENEELDNLDYLEFSDNLNVCKGFLNE